MIYHSKPTQIHFDTHKLRQIEQSGMLVNSVFTKQAEHGMAQLVQKKHVSIVNSGTSALTAAIIALRLPEKSHIAIPDNTCSSVYFAVRNLGHVPVICDIYENNLAINVESLSTENIKKLRAIIVVHPFGLSVDIERYRPFNLPIIEDCATAIGGEINGKPVGSLGDISVFSFYATKMLTCGEGGAVATNNAEYYKIIEDVVSSDMPTYDELSHYNFKITEIQAVLLNDQLEKLSQFIKKRQKIAQKYNTAFNDLTINIALNQFSDNTTNNHYRYLIRFENKQLANNYINFTKQHKIVCTRPAYKHLSEIFSTDNNHRVSKKVYKQLVSIPIYPSISDAEIAKIITTTQQFYHEYIRP